MSSLVHSAGAIMRVKRPKPWGAQLNSTLEATFEQGIKALKFPPWERNFVFLDGRAYELDFAWPQWFIGIEIEGACHRIRERFHSDIEKHALAVLAGWKILRLDGRSIRSGVGFQWAEAFLWQYRGLD